MDDERVAEQLQIPGTLGPVEERPWAELVEGFLTARRNPNTRGGYRRDLADWAAWCEAAGLDPARAGPFAVVDYLEACLELGLAGATVARRRAAMKGVYQWAKERRHRPDSPFDHVSTSHNGHYATLSLPDYLTKPERDALVDAARRSEPRGVPAGAARNTAIVTLGSWAGLRLSEMCDLDHHDVDLTARTARVRQGKGDKDREILLHPLPAAEIGAYLATRTDAEPPVFLSRRGGRLSPRAIQHLLGDLARSAGLRKRIRPHTLRHTFATHLLADTGDLRVVQEALGHASIRTTEIYTHVANSRLRRAIDGLT